MANAIEKQKKEGLDSWESKIEPYTVDNSLYRNIKGMDVYMREEIRQLSKEGYMHIITLSGPAIGLDHGKDRLFVDDFKGGTYYFFIHELVRVERLLSSKIKPHTMEEGRNRALMIRCLVKAGFDKDDARDIIGMRLERDMKIGVHSNIDVRR